MAFNTFKGLNRSLQGYTNTQEHLWPSKLLIWLFFSLSNSPHITYPPCASRPKCHRRKKKKHFSINSCLISLLVLDSYSQYTVGKISGFFFFSYESAKHWWERTVCIPTKVHWGCTFTDRGPGSFTMTWLRFLAPSKWCCYEKLVIDVRGVLFEEIAWPLPVWEPKSLL